MWFVFALVLCQAVEGHLSNPRVSDLGIIATDSKCSAVYLLNGERAEKLISHAGAGRYYTVSPNRKYVAFKLIRESGEQIPAIYDLAAGSITNLHEPIFRAGQPSFSNDGKIAFTIGEDLHVKTGAESKVYHLGVYANLCPISPDGRFAVFNDDDDQLWVLNLETGGRACFTDSRTGYCYPAWSPNSRYIAYSTLDGVLLVYDRLSNEHHRIGQGRSADWSSDSEYLVYHKLITDGHVLLNSELWLSKCDGSESWALTCTGDRKEMGPVFDGETGIIFHTYTAGEICRGEIIDSRLQNVEVLHTMTEPLGMDCPYPVSDFGMRDSIDVPYLNQVYDTPDWHNGHWSCAPTAAMMAIAYYRRLPYWDCWCSTPYGHTSHFGNYICSVYHYREVTYDLVAQDPSNNDAWGGYGYMWYNGYSPYSRMMNYLQYHNLTSWSDNTPTWTETLAEVQAGWPYCMCVGLTAAGHLILAVGQVEDWHTLIFNDPYGNKNTPGYPSYDGKYARYDWPGYNNGYENLNQVYWCRGARGDWLPACDTIVDDLQYQYTGEPYGFFIFNEPPSTMRYFHDALNGYGGHMWWTYATASADTCYVTWTPQLTQSGDYEVFAYISGVYATANARYQVYYDGGNTTAIIDQAGYSDEWVSLGVYPFALSGGYVYLGDATGTAGDYVGFDAMRWSFVTQVAEEDKKIAREQIRIESTIVGNELALFASHFDRGQIRFSVFDISGKLVLEERTSLNRANQRITINTSRLASGVYFLKVSLAGSEDRWKFIKLR